MLYSAVTMRGVEVAAADGTRLGRLVDAYANTETAVVERLIVDASAAAGGVRMFPADKVREYDTERRRLTLDLSVEQAAGAELVPKGIPVLLIKPGDEAGAELRVMSSVVGFMVDAVDGPVGQAADFLVDSDGLVIRYLVVDTRDWLPGSDKLVPIEWLESIDWTRQRMFLKLTQARIRTCQRASPGSHLLDRT